MISKEKAVQNDLKTRLNEVIFGAETKAGRIFDIILLIVISFSIFLVFMDSVPEVNKKYHRLFYGLEWGITIIFTLEYALRIYITRHPHKYIFSFYGIIDLLSVLPTYLSLVLFGSQYLIVIRAIRLLRIFRILKFTRYTSASQILVQSLKASKYKIAVFFGAIVILVILMGSIMYLIEGENPGFSSIPKSIYWAIITLTTVGYGDITPATVVGQGIASVIMIVGYAIIAVPTGIITVELSKARNKETKTKFICNHCNEKQHDDDAIFCKSCGHEID